MSLKDYKNKRNFQATPEPAGNEAKGKRKQKPSGLRFVVQLHDASRKHYDVRLELDGTMKSWAVPKGPSLDPVERRLAVEVEDHPMAYNEFEGVIPPGNYGAGVVMIWDEGTYNARSIDFPAKDEEDAIRRGLAKGHLTIILHGSKLRGEFALIRLAKGGGNGWLLVKKHDNHASRGDITHADRSARSGRTLGEIATNAVKEGKLWNSRAKSQSTKKPSTTDAIKAKRVATKKEHGSQASRKILAPKFRKLATRKEFVKTKKLPTWVPVPSSTPTPEQIIQPVHDGYRCMLTIDSEGNVALHSKNDLPLTKRFPQLVKDLSSVLGPLALDGLIVPVDEQSIPRRRGRLEASQQARYAFFAYDLLHADGYDTTSLPLTDRLSALKQMQIDRESSALRLISAQDGNTLIESVADAGWLIRVKNSKYEGNEVARTTRNITSGDVAASALKPARNTGKTIPAPAPPSGSRHHIVSRTARPGAKPQLSLSNLDKVYWPADHITKGQLIDYYRHVSSIMLPHLQDRPQSLNRHPNGIDASSFFQKEVSGHVPGWMQTATIASGRSGKNVTYALCQTETDLLFLANLGCIEINTWLSRVDTINQPDYIVFDLDPGDVPFDAVIDVAKAVKKLLDKIKAPAFCKTSGSRGLHIYVPVSQVDSYDDARQFAEQFCQVIHRQLPEITSLERSPDRRKNKIYLDYLQNRVGQTMAAIYSVRPKPQAPVSTPLKWTEVKHGLDPRAFTIATIPTRIKRLGDLWAGILDAAVPLNTCQQALARYLQGSKP